MCTRIAGNGLRAAAQPVEQLVRKRSLLNLAAAVNGHRRHHPVAICGVAAQALMVQTSQGRNCCPRLLVFVLTVAAAPSGSNAVNRELERPRKSPNDAHPVAAVITRRRVCNQCVYPYACRLNMISRQFWLCEYRAACSKLELNTQTQQQTANG